jgi:hypothetical protein
VLGNYLAGDSFLAKFWLPSLLGILDYFITTEAFSFNLSTYLNVLIVWSALEDQIKIK